MCLLHYGIFVFIAVEVIKWINDMSSFEFIVSFGFVLLSLSIAMGAYFYALQKRKDSYYNEEKKRVELDLLRHNLDSQIYELSERANKKSEKWSDAYNLQSLKFNNNSSGVKNMLKIVSK